MFNLEMNSEHEIYLYECLGVLEYSDDSILLDFNEFSVRVSGADLSMISYSNGEMYIEGEILRIEFESGDTKKANESSNATENAA